MVKPEMGDKGGSSTDEEVRVDVMIRNIEVRGDEVKVKVIVIVKVKVVVKQKVVDKGSSTDEEVKIELCAYKGNSVSEKK